jgi:hypothetical protein
MEGSMASAVRRLARDLELPSGDAYTQDWVYELPEAYRDYAHFLKYLAAYERPEYGDAERRLLMQLMLDVTNDLLSAGDADGREAWEHLKGLLTNDAQLHHEEIERWAGEDEPLEDMFVLTPYVRELRQQWLT